MPFVTDFTGIPYDIKDPNSTIEYPVDWTAWLAERNDTINAVQWTLTGSLVNVSSSFTAAGRAAIFISGGTLGEIDLVRCRITTVGGLVEYKSFNLRIQTK